MKETAMTVTDHATTLSEQINQARERAHAQAGTTIEKLVKIAGWLGLRETSERLTATAALLASVKFHLMVMGRMKNGKSTLLNALLEGTTQPVAMSTGRGLMAVGTLPTTAVLTTVHYADKPSVKVQRIDGSSEEWKFDQYLRDSVLTEDNEENARLFEQIMEFQIGSPGVWCGAGFMVGAPPGPDEPPLRTKIPEPAPRQADAALRPSRSDVLMGEKELAEATKVRTAGPRLVP